MNFGTWTEIGAPEIAIKRHSPVAFALKCANLLMRSQILHAVGEKIRVGVSEDEGAALHDGDEAREVEDFSVRISAIEKAGEE